MDTLMALVSYEPYSSSHLPFGFQFQSRAWCHTLLWSRLLDSVLRSQEGYLTLLLWCYELALCIGCYHRLSDESLGMSFMISPLKFFPHSTTIKDRWGRAQDTLTMWSAAAKAGCWTSTLFWTVTCFTAFTELLVRSGSYAIIVDTDFSTACPNSTALLN